MCIRDRGKTTLAGIIAKVSNSHFVNLNATNAGIGELRTIIEDARKRVRSLQQRTILFLDEIHRFNKSQQDVLLPCVEDGTIILIGEMCIRDRALHIACGNHCLIASKIIFPCRSLICINLCIQPLLARWGNL